MSWSTGCSTQVERPHGVSFFCGFFFRSATQGSGSYPDRGSVDTDSKRFKSLSDSRQNALPTSTQAAQRSEAKKREKAKIGGVFIFLTLLHYWYIPTAGPFGPTKTNHLP